MRLNVIVYLDIVAYNEAIDFSTICNKFAETNFVLDGKKCFPHITLYFPNYPTNILPKIKDILSNVANNTNAFKLKFKDTTIAKIDGGIFANYEQNDEGIRLKDLVVNLLNPLRNGLIREKYKNDPSKDVVEFGYPINKYHFPHVTLTSFVDMNNAKEFINKRNNIIFSDIMVDTIAICEMGEHGTCTKIIEKFKLKN